MTVVWVSYGAAVGISAVAAAIDFRTGRIPNWLTLPPLVIAPVTYAAVGGWRMVPIVLFWIFVCGLVPYILFRMGAAGGGDVKVLAAIGAVAGLSVGLATQLIAITASVLFVLGRRAWRGGLRSTLGNMVRVAAGPLLPKKWRREVEPEALTRVRLGPFILLGAVLAVAQRYFFGG